MPTLNHRLSCNNTCLHLLSTPRLHRRHFQTLSYLFLTFALSYFFFPTHNKLHFRHSLPLVCFLSLVLKVPQRIHTENLSKVWMCERKSFISIGIVIYLFDPDQSLGELSHLTFHLNYQKEKKQREYVCLVWFVCTQTLSGQLKEKVNHTG